MCQKQSTSICKTPKQKLFKSFLTSQGSSPQSKSLCLKSKILTLLVTACKIPAVWIALRPKDPKEIWGGWRKHSRMHGGMDRKEKPKEPSQIESLHPTYVPCALQIAQLPTCQIGVATPFFTSLACSLKPKWPSQWECIMHAAYSSTKCCGALYCSTFYCFNHGVPHKDLMCNWCYLIISKTTNIFQYAQRDTETINDWWDKLLIFFPFPEKLEILHHSQIIQSKHMMLSFSTFSGIMVSD